MELVRAPLGLRDTLNHGPRKRCSGDGRSGSLVPRVRQFGFVRAVRSGVRRKSSAWKRYGLMSDIDKGRRAAENSSGIKTIADLKPDSKNARKHGERNIGMLERSLEQYGALDRRGRGRPDHRRS
jgi:hypothetical protein